MNRIQQFHQFLIIVTLGKCFFLRVRINDLISKCSQRKIWLLRYIKQFTSFRFCHASAYIRACEMMYRCRGVHLPNKGHKSPKIRKSELLPHPFGPEIKQFMPVLTLNDRSLTRISLLGVTIGTLSNTMTPSRMRTLPFVLVVSTILFLPALPSSFDIIVRLYLP